MLKLPRRVGAAGNFRAALGVAFQFDVEIVGEPRDLPGERGENPIAIRREFCRALLEDRFAVPVKDADAHAVRGDFQIQGVLLG
jgi:hypothetical protein